jgi:hypothetical protein
VSSSPPSARGSPGWNDDPRPFVWHKTADEILDSLAAYCQRIKRLRSLADKANALRQLLKSARTTALGLGRADVVDAVESAIATMDFSLTPDR